VLIQFGTYINTEHQEPDPHIPNKDSSLYWFVSHSGECMYIEMAEYVVKTFTFHFTSE